MKFVKLIKSKLSSLTAEHRTKITHTREIQAAFPKEDRRNVKLAETLKLKCKERSIRPHESNGLHTSLNRLSTIQRILFFLLR